MDLLNHLRWVNGLFKGTLQWSPTANNTITLPPNKTGTVSLTDDWGVAFAAPSTNAITVPLDSSSSNFAVKTVTAPISFTAAALATRTPGSIAYYSLIANGVSAVSFVGMSPDGGPQFYNNTNGVTNQIRIRWDGQTVFYRIDAPAYGLPTLNPVALTFPMSNFVLPVGGGYISTAAGVFSGTAVSTQLITANKDFEFAWEADVEQLVGLNTTQAVEGFANWEHYVWNGNPTIFTGQSGAAINSGWTATGMQQYKIERISGVLTASYRLNALAAWIPVRTWPGLNNAAYYVMMSLSSGRVMQALSLKVQA